MQLLTVLLASAGVVQAHYNFNALIYSGSSQPTWQQVRKRTDADSHGPVTDVSLLDLRCGKGASAAYAPGILSIAAGQNISYVVDPEIQHPGPGMGYLAKVPSGQTAATWDGSGAVWFKVWEIGATSFNSNGGTWPTSGLTQLGFPIPKDTPSGDYLVRIEHIGLHSAGQSGGAQFYLSCGQVTITGGGSGVPGPLVAFPGAYKATDPGILFQIYYPVPTSYTIPGPKVWTGGDSGSGSGSDTGGGAATTVASGPTTTAAGGGTTTSSVSTGPTVSKYGQCGGSGWTGGTSCASGSTCTHSSDYYWQCL